MRKKDNRLWTAERKAIHDRALSKKPLHYYAMQTIRKHRRKGITVNVTVEELEYFLKDKHHCANPSCNVSVELFFGKGKPCSGTTLSVDRIDNDGALSLDNIQVLCLSCTARKGDMSLSDWQYQIDHWNLKKCAGCGNWFPRTEYLAKKDPTQLYSYCKVCARAKGLIKERNYRERKKMLLKDGQEQPS